MKKCICFVVAMLLVASITGCVYEEGGNNVVCDHSYSSSTCTRQAQCTKCGKIGAYGPHSYADGVCVHCNAVDPDWEPPVLTGGEYERINSLMEGIYQFRLNTGNLVEYQFEDGAFICYTEIGGTIIENKGTYTLTEKTLVLYYQNGTVKDCPWKINSNGEIELFLLDLD